MHLKIVLLISIYSVAIAACSTTGFTTSRDLVVPRTVAAPTNIPAEIAPYVVKFADALESAGFKIGETDDPDALRLQMEFNPNPFNTRVSALLIHHQVPVLSASATNPGWGTAMFRGVAVEGRADAALENFRVELAKLMQRVKFKTPAP